MKKLLIILSIALSSILVAGCSSGIPDCSDQAVKDTIISSYTERLVGSGIPDLLQAISDGRIKFSLAMITEVSRNKESKNVNCSAQLTMSFPKDDLDRARKYENEHSISMGAIKIPMSKMWGEIPTDTESSAAIKYVAASSADKKEGPIVQIDAWSKPDEDAANRYLAVYIMQSFSVSDINQNSKNSEKWDKQFKDAVIEECSKGPMGKNCTCKMDHFEKLLSQHDFTRIGFNINALKENPMAVAANYGNFEKVLDGLNNQCPLTQEVTLAPEQQASVASSPSSQTTASLPVVSATATAVISEKPAASDLPKIASPSIPIPLKIEASFDCAKASSAIEKMICSTPESATADKNLSATYNAVKSKMGANSGQYKADQIKWMKEIRNACTDVACLVKVINARSEQLAVAGD